MLFLKLVYIYSNDLLKRFFRGRFVMRKIREEKRAKKKLKRKAYGIWRPMTWVSGILAVIMIIATLVISVFDNTITLLAGGKFWELEKEDENAVYYASDFETEEERVERGYGEAKIQLLRWRNRR